MDEFEADVAPGHVEGMTVRTYNMKSHRWSIYLSSQANGTVDFPPMVGGFKDSRGEFYDSETYNGRAIYVRFSWTVSSPDTCHWEQVFFADGGRTWEANSHLGSYEREMRRDGRSRLQYLSTVAE